MESVRTTSDPLQNIGARIATFTRTGNPKLTGSATSSMGDKAKSRAVEILEELDSVELKQLDADKFVAEKCVVVGEKGLKRVCAELAEHGRLSLEEMRMSVYSNYASFIRTSKEISDLDVQLKGMKLLLSLQAALIHSLAEQSQGTVAIAVEPEEDEPDQDPWEEDPELRPIELRAQAIPDQLDILVAERRVNEAIDLLEEGEEIAARSFYREGDPGDLLEVQGAAELAEQLADRRERLQEQLADVTRQPTATGDELRAAVLGLHRLGDSQRAHTLLLSAYKNKIRARVRQLRHSGASYGGAYTVALAQLVFSTISQAAKDSVSIWQEEPEYASELVLWAQKETEWCAGLLKRHVLSSSGSAGGLHAAAECVTIALGHCTLLEDQGLSLAPVLSKLMRPSVEEAIDAHIFRIEESVAAMAAADNWKLQPLPGGLKPAKGALPEPGSLLLSSSAQRLYTMLQDFVEDLAPVISLQLMGPTLDKMAHLFEEYVGLLIKALPSAEDGEDLEWDGPSVKIAYEEQQQLALLGNAALLADELLPRLVTRLTMVPELQSQAQMGRNSRKREAEMRRSLARNQNEQKEWRRRLQKAVDKLRDILCSCLVADFMYGDDGQPLLTADEYLQMDAQMTTEEWQMSPMPSPPFQALFVALNAISGTASDVLAERERVVTLLLMRLAEWLMMGLMMYSQFWEQFEESEYALGPVGLQQLVLDMYFVMQVAANGKFSSRAMRKVALDSMAKAITMYKEQSGDDPNRLLEKDAWFHARCQEAIHILLGSHPGVYEGGPMSPTESDMNSAYYEDQYMN